MGVSERAHATPRSLSGWYHTYIHTYLLTILTILTVLYVTKLYCCCPHAPFSSLLPLPSQAQVTHSLHCRLGRFGRWMHLSMRRPGVQYRNPVVMVVVAVMVMVMVG